MDFRSILKKLSELDSVEQKNIDAKLEAQGRFNPVAKNINKFNKPATHRDRKKDMKAGKEKHKRGSADYSSIKEELYQKLAQKK